MPAGLRGIVVAGLLSAPMGSLAGVFNACSTLFTVDNLLLLLQDLHQQQGVENTAENQRRQKRLAQQQTELQKTGQTLPLIHTLFRRFTQATFKLIRWLRVHWHRPTSLPQALPQLRSIYAKL